MRPELTPRVSLGARPLRVRMLGRPAHAWDGLAIPLPCSPCWARWRPSCSGGLEPVMPSRLQISPAFGLHFEVSMTDCWHNPETGVFVSRPGQSGKTLLFLYRSVEVPAITSIDEQTIQIALDDVNSVFCRKDRWQDLTIRYDILSIRYPGNLVNARPWHPLPPTCCRAAPRPMPRPSAGRRALRSTVPTMPRPTPSIAATWRTGRTRRGAWDSGQICPSPDFEGARTRVTQSAICRTQNAAGSVWRHISLVACRLDRRRATGDADLARPDLVRPARLKAAPRRALLRRTGARTSVWLHSARLLRMSAASRTRSIPAAEVKHDFNTIDY